MFYVWLFIACLGSAAEWELFCDWNWNLKGEIAAFEGSAEEELPLPHLLSRKLKARGDHAICWEIDAYQPWLLTWKGVKNWQDFKHWLGLGLPRKTPFRPDTKYWMFWNLGPKLAEFDFSRVPQEKLVLVMWEPPTTQPELYAPEVQAKFGKIFTWDDDLVDNQKFFKLYYPALKPMPEKLPAFEDKKFCVMICRRLKSKHPKELYSERKKVIQFFEDRPVGEFDLFGYHWEREKFKNYKGSIPDKLETLKNYKFSICYENMGHVKGYVTEKIFDCFGAGVVPVYWGASNITDYVPADCFIDRRLFKNEEELYRFLKAMTQEEYEGYIHRIRLFLKSDMAQRFTAEYFLQDYLSRL